MKKILSISLVAMSLVFFFCANIVDKSASVIQASVATPTQETAISPAETSNATTTPVGEGWLTWEQAVEKQKKEPRKMIVDVYTDWCGWCKKMDASTFVDPEVVKYLGEKFYAVKLDAEQKGDIVFNGETFKHVMPEGARRGVHTLAYALLDGKMSYPTVVYLDESYARIMVSPGYKGAADIMKELRFAGENHYKTQNWEDFKGK